MAKIAVVIPVYNVQDYLARCVDSVLAQTLDDLQIILVDDGSPDESPAMCDAYAAKDARVTVIHKPNGGLASARNAGMAVCDAEYLFFLDSDDWLELDGLETLYRKAEETGVDFVRYRAIRTGWPGLPEHAPCMVEPIRELEEGLYDRRRILEEVYPRLLVTSQLTMGSIVGAWGSLYRLSFLKQHDLRFYEEVKFSEDLVFSARVARAADRFYFIDTPGVYHYFYNAASISKSFREGRWDSCKSLIRSCEADFAEDADYDFSSQLSALRWFCILLALNERRHLTSYAQRKHYCKTIMDDPVVKETPLSLHGLQVSWKQKCLMRLIKAGCTGLVARM